ncbi:MAG: MFS transporter [Coriobacteriia bacterium]|nr:MFS transporter [Coriobacteriia bacterium]
MQYLKEHPRAKVVFAILLLFALASIFVIFTCVGKEIESPFITKVELKQPVYFANDDVDDDIYTAIDKGCHRVLFLNKNKEVRKQLNFDCNSDLLTYAYATYSRADEIYVCGLFVTEDDHTPDEVRLLKYNNRCEFVDIEYSTEYDNSQFSKLYRIDYVDGHIQVFWADSEYVYIDIIEDGQRNPLFRTPLNERIVQVLFNHDDKSYICVTDTASSIKILDGKITQIDIQDFILGKYGINLPEFDFSRVVANISNIDINKNEINYSMPDLDSVYIQDVDTKEIKCYKTFNFEGFHIVKNIIIWCAIVYMILVVIVLIVFYVRKQIKNQFSGLKKILIALGVIVLLVSVTIYSSINFYGNSKNRLYSDIYSVSNCIKDGFYYTDAELNNNLVDKEKLSSEQFVKNVKEIDKLAMDNYSFLKYFFKDDLISSFNLYGYNAQTNSTVNMYDVKDSKVLGSDSISFTEDDLRRLKNNEIIITQSDLNAQEYILSCVPLFNTSKQFVGSLVFSISMNDLDKDYINNFKNQIIFFAVAILAIYLLMMELASFIRSHIKFRTSMREKFAHSEVHMTETMEFLKNLIYSVDSVLCVLISKGMLDSYGLGDNGVLIGLPIILWGFGSFTGTLIYPKLIKKLSIRSIFVLGNVCTVITMLGLAAATIANSFIVFVLLKFVYGIAYSFVHAGDATLPMCIEDKKLRFDILRGSSLSEVSAPILSVLVAGVVATIIGNYAIYVFGAGLGVLMLIASFVYMPAKQKFRNTNKNLRKKLDRKVMLKFIFSPSILIIILVCLVSLLVGAYKSFLFPLLTDSMSISKVEISNYFIIASAFVFVLSRSFDRFTKNFDHWYVVVAGLVSLGLIFVFFMFNDTLLWAILVFFMSALIQKSLNAEWRMLWPRKCEREKIDPTTIQPLFSIIDSFGLSIRTAVLGSFLVFGVYGACVALGISLLLTAVIFVVFTRKSSIR